METSVTLNEFKIFNLRTKTLAEIIFGTAFILSVLLIGMFMDESAYAVDFANRSLAPSLAHPFGTDWLGRDMLARTVKGMTTSIQIGLFASLISSVIAVILGTLAATKGKKTDAFILWLIDLFQGKPHLVFLMFISILAEKVETSEEFDMALDMGYDYFQGYYFAKPTLFNYKDVASTSYTCFRMLEVLSSSSPTYEELADIVEKDVAMSYKLFKYANSPIYGGRSQLTSVQDALVRLGFKNIHNWIYLIILRSISYGQSNDLLSVSLQRAKMLEGLAIQFELPKKRSEYFITGLFSLVDILTSKPIEEAVENLSLSTEIKNAIISKEGRLGESLELIIAYESGNWQTFETICKHLKLKVNAVIQAYFESLDWAQNTILNMA